MHKLSTHRPWPEQFFSHVGTTREQSAALKPASQWHVPLKHAPWPVQLPAQPPLITSHVGPLKPTSHSQPKTKTPCGES